IDSPDTFSTKIDQHNYPILKFHFKAFIRGKGLLDILDGLKFVPTEDKEKKAWEADNGKIITWLVNSVSVDIAMELTSFEKALKMWSHLHTLEQDQVFAASISANALKDFMTTMKRTRRGKTTNCFSSSGNSNKYVQCYHCKEIGDLISHCKKRNYCNYCKKDGHIILECRKKSSPWKLSTPYNYFQAMAMDTGTQETPSTKVLDLNDMYKMIQESLVVALPNAISSALRDTYPGKTELSDSTVWHNDFAASNHMNGNQKLFSDLSKPYSRHEIVTANGHVLTA
ncbi:hypothetical protein H5410_014514, partial [Solanum commersonii]